ncbi:MAG TPA: hypothetical protein VMG10_29600 [Gemmataceae bacterium]|nr:hypothetical protein [Gemmataceae bacterium]
MELKPTEGELTLLLEREAHKAEAAGRKPFVEFFANWCPPCLALRKSMTDPLMIEAFEGTYLIRLDADEWSGKLSGTGLSASRVPIFFELDKEGKPTGRTITSGAWKEDIPSNMAPVLNKFFKE